MDDAGDTAGAAAMCMLIVVTSIGVRVGYGLLTRGVERRFRSLEGS